MAFQPVATPALWRDLVKILTRKLFLMERTDFENVIFEKITWAPSEDAEVAEVKWPETQNDENYNFNTITYMNEPHFFGLSST